MKTSIPVRIAALVALVALGVNACSSDTSSNSEIPQPGATSTTIAANEPAPAPLSGATVGAVQPIVDAWAEANDVSMLAVSVRSPSGLVTSVGYAAEGEAPGDRSLFIAGSLGKTMEAATTLLLVEDGVLDLDEPIARWLPEFPRADEITLRLLLSHTAGLTDRRPESGLNPGPEALAPYEAGSTPAELLARAAGVVGDASLPAAHSYSTASFWVAGAVIESATGESLADVMRARVFEALGMADSYLAWPEALDLPLVGGELTLLTGDVVPLGTEIIPGIMSTGWGPGGVLASARDVAVFYGRLFEDLLAPASVDAMTTTTPESGDDGLGIEMRQWAGETTGWGHGGVAIGYRSAAGVTEDGWSVAVLTNHFDIASGGVEPDPDALIAELLEHIGTDSLSDESGS